MAYYIFSSAEYLFYFMFLKMCLIVFIYLEILYLCLNVWFCSN